MFKLPFTDRVKFFIERQFVKGAAYQLLLVVALVGLISLTGGLLVLSTGAPLDHLGSAVWWAFLRLTDPGYLGDDEGAWRRIISTWLTISGYVVFMGTLVAIMTRWLIAIMNRLEKGLTPVSLRNHVVILGWNNRTVPLLRELLKSVNRMRRFLLEHDARYLRLVVLTENVSTQQVMLLTQDKGIGRRSKDIILRSGTALQPEALLRAACLNAAVIIIPSESHGPQSLVTSDVETIKALLSIAAQAKAMQVSLPLAVVEIEDVRKLPVVQRAYPGPLEVVAGDSTISRLMAQNILHPGLSEFYEELLTGHAGNELYLRSAEAFAGKTLAEVAAVCPDAILCGLLQHDGQQWHARLNQPSATVLTSEDKLVLMAPSYEKSEPKPGVPLLPLIERNELHDRVVDGKTRAHKLLILGWSRRVPALVTELASYPGQEFEVDLVSVFPALSRADEIRRYAESTQRVNCRHIEADYMVEGELRSLEPSHYDSILLLSSDLLGSGEEADARAIVGYLVLDDILQDQHRRPQILLELSDPANETLVVRNNSETLISPLILSHLLSQIALRRELRLVYDELFTASGAEILFLAQESLALGENPSFRTLEELAAGQGDTALGIYRASPDTEGRRLQLNPPRGLALELQSGDQLVVLSTL
ncbi:MAG: ion channel DMI1 [Pseudomonadales bacterium]|nr:ion channel DMI1 [Pseudomonadales bacterium]